MRRTSLWVIPLLGIGIGGVLLWIGRSAQDRPTSPPSSSPPEQAARASVPAAPPSTSSETPAATPGETRGGLRLHVFSGDAPVVGASVTICRGAAHQEMSFETQEGGLRTVLNLPEDVYHGEVKHPGHLTEKLNFRIARGQGTTVKVSLKPENVVVGTVRDIRSKPLAGARITLIDPSKGGQASAVPQHLFTDAEGAYTIPGVPAGNYGVRAWVDGYRSGKTQRVSFGSAGERREVHFMLEEGSTLSGRVVDDRDQPVEGAGVVASNEEVATAKTDAQGSFKIRGLGAGTASAFVSGEGFATARLFGLLPGSENVVFRVTRNGSLVGRLEAEPAPPSWTLLLEAEEPETGTWRPIRREPVVTPENVRLFLLPEVAPGTYRVSVEAPGWESAEKPLVTVKPGERVEGLVFRLRAAAK